MKTKIINCVLLVLLSAVFFKPVTAQVTPGDSLALVKFYDVLDGPNWTFNTNWKSTSPVRLWFGITVNNNRVTEINLSSNNLTGQLPVEIGDLLGLRVLNVSSNGLQGAVPASIKNCTQLDRLILGWNNYADDSFPAELGQLSALTMLNLTSSNLNGAPDWVFSLTNLHTLYLSYNNITNIPVALENLSLLTALDISYNPLNGVLPAQLFKLSNLTYLNLGSTGLTDIPDFITNMAWLESLYLYSNSLDEADTKNFTNFGALKTLSLVGNQFTQIPPEVTALSTLTRLYLSSNQISDTGVGNLANLTGLTNLAFSYNKLTMVPTGIFAMNGLQTLDLGNNLFSGTIPVQLGGYPNLFSLYLNGNQFEGRVPNEIAAMGTLRYLRLEDNNLDGLPAFSATNNFNEIQLQNNYFTFEDIVPNVGLAANEVYAPQKEIGVGMDSVTTLGSVVELRQLIGGTGNDYQWFKDGFEVSGATSATLQVQLNSAADFGRYQLRATNTMAPELEIWSAPFILRRDNQLEQDSLALADLYNALNGDSWNNTSSWLTDKVTNWFGVMVEGDRVVELRLASNNLQGELPTSIGSLTALRVLQLNNNQIIGAVPQEIDALVALEEVQLQFNQLEAIPDFTALDALKIIKLEQNRLTFEDLIPSKGAASSTFTYAPQDSLPTQSQQAYALGSYISLEVPTHHSDNFYNWFRAGTDLSTNQNPYVISLFDYTDQGIYHCQVTNPQLPGLTLYAEAIHLEVMDAPIIIPGNGIVVLPRSAYIPFTVNANGPETNVFVNYGFSGGYGLGADWQGEPFTGAVQQNGEILLEDLVPNRTYHYQVVANNNLGQWATSDLTFSTPEYPGNFQVSEHFSLPSYGKPGDYTVYDYRMFGMPGSEVFSVAEIFSGDAWDDWLAYRDNGGPDYYYEEWDASENFNFGVGKAFWVVSLHDADINRTVNSAPLNAQSEVEISLQNGWNLITNPFLQDVEWADVSLLNGFGGISLYAYDGDWKSSDRMRPYEGYLFQKPDQLNVLRIPYPGTPIAKQATVSKNTTTWQVNVALLAGERSDATVHFGYHPEEPGFYRQTEHPRAPGKGLSIWISDPQSGRELATDFRFPESDGCSWQLQARMKKGQPNRLHFSGVDECPAGTSLWLVHLQSGRKVCLDSEAQLTILPDQELNDFVVLSGAMEYVQEQIAQLIPQSFDLQQNYPNPFNPQTQISYQLPGEAQVRLDVFNSLGQHVRTLVNRSQDAGFYQVHFEAGSLASGIYYYRLKTPQFTKMRKMLLVR